jgi:aryl-alcohol dehydrogenase-like predicted oxidoreductase
MCTSRSYIFKALEASLRRLRTDYIDIYMLHWPDLSTSIEESLNALTDLVRQGKVRYIGYSNLSAWRAVEALWTSRHNHLASFVTGQYEYSLLNRKIEADILPMLQAYELGFIPYFPLASGLLTGKYGKGKPLTVGTRIEKNLLNLQTRFHTEANLETIAKLERFATARNRSLIELAFGWLRSRPMVSSIIAGATTPEQLEQNVKAFQWLPTPDEVKEVEGLCAT